MTEKEWLERPCMVCIERDLIIPEQTQYGEIKTYEYMCLYGSEEQLKREINRLNDMPNTKRVCEKYRKTNAEKLRDDLEMINQFFDDEGEDEHI